ncbi:MAG: hypothetical protein IJ696_03925 [Ruminococcus sp.]|nr:hypothetical protein [Ruminococcus sp.]
MGDTRLAATLRLYNNSQLIVTHTLTKCISFTVTKERYTPFHKASFTFIADEETDTSVIREVSILYGDRTLFYGRAEELSFSHTPGKMVITGRASGFTKGLSTCAAEPGIIFNCTIAQLFSRFPYMAHIGYTATEDVMNYIFVKENDTLWTSIVNLAQKLYDEYPFIRGTNMVTIKKENLSSFDYRDETIVNRFSGENFTGAVSAIHMKGTEDTYDYHYTDAEVTARGIIRERYIPLDRQWLNDPETGLRHKMYFSRRGGIYRGFVYAGHRNEELCDRVRFSYGGSAYWAEADKIVIKGDAKGVFTTIVNYDDGYAKISDV